jgi:hypothetical protein
MDEAAFLKLMLFFSSPSIYRQRNSGLVYSTIGQRAEINFAIIVLLA